MNRTFILPDFSKLRNTGGRDKVVIVSIVGKSKCYSRGLKAKSIGRFFPDGCNTNSEFSIEASYDKKNHVLYLHLLSLLDTDFLIKHYEKIAEKQKTDNFLVVNEEIKNNFTRALLFLFSTSHIVIITQPRHSFDTDYIQYFKAAENMRQQYWKEIKSSLGGHCMWKREGRLCKPHILFYFERCPKGVFNSKRFEHHLRTQIVRILNRVRSPLFIVPKEDFIFVAPKNEHSDLLGDSVRGLINDCKFEGPLQFKQPFLEHTFPDVLKTHIEQFRICDELPVLSSWIDFSTALFGVILQKDLMRSLCTETRFSEERCAKTVPLALSMYQEKLPHLYSQSEHNRRLTMAVAFYNAHARGPSVDPYLTQLRFDCISLWENRQQCEAISLTGHPCTLPKHSQGNHSSGFIYKATCDCGRTMGQRQDPFAVKEANYTFYSKLSCNCGCEKLERINFDGLPLITEEALNLDLGDILAPNKFSNWSLVCLGSARLYDHKIGFPESQHAGFLAGTNFLLEWDVNVYVEQKPSWFLNYLHKVRRGRPWTSSTKFAVKAFIGAEYECLDGHRFMLATPDRMLQANMARDTGQKIAENDLPLYYACVCNSTKLAQLMRLHMVTPRAPVHCSFNPKVCPAPGGPIFVPTLDKIPMLSEASYWIMRLPFRYALDTKHDHQNFGGKLLKGAFSIKEIE